MYLEHYHLKTKPFQITADPKFLWLGEKHKEALATLRYGIMDNRGFLLLTGEVGTGKTILINRLVSMLDIDTVVATLPDPDLESMDFYNLLADGLKMDRAFNGKGEFLIHLRDFLHQSYADRKQVLLVIDESQRLNHRLMEDIRVLSNIELQDRKLINIFFVGQQEFNSILMAPQNRALAQRITVRYHIEPLDEKEVGEYVQHRLKIAGSTQELFNPSAMVEVFRFSGGIPRLINIICDHALLTGYARGIKLIDNQVIKECAEELRIPVPVVQTNYNGSRSDTSSAKIVGSSSMTEPPGKIDGDQPLAEETFVEAPNAGNSGIHDIDQPPRSLGWKLAYASMIFLLIALVAFTITHFTVTDRPRWGAEELTPQKYRTSLEREKALLESRLEKDKMAPEDTSSPPSIADSQSSKGGDKTAVVKEQTTSKNSIKKTAAVETEKNSPKADVSSRPLEDLAKLTSNKPMTVTGGDQIEPLPLMKEKIIIHFKINSNEIDKQSYEVLDRVANYLVKHPDERVFVRGYTDSSGSPGYNESVSQFRANAVKSYLIGKGATPDKVMIFAMGAVNPIASNDSFEGRSLNRRVEIEFPQKQVTEN